MNNKHLCPCCSHPLLRHASFKKIYWFCSQCHQEMPDLEGLLKTEVYSRHWITHTIRNRRPLENNDWFKEKLFTWLETIKEFQHFAFLDSLTQLANRPCFEAYLNQEWQCKLRDQVPISLIISELDFFKVYRDNCGSKAADKCLQQVAKAIVKVAKHPASFVAHYGREEFIIVQSNTTAEQAVQVAEKIRAEVKALKINQTSYQTSKPLTLSSGVASMIPADNYSPVMLITAALRALYQAKTQGHDCVVLYETLLRQTQPIEQAVMAALPPLKDNSCRLANTTKPLAATHMTRMTSLETRQELHRLAFLDQLTQVANRRRLQTYLDQQWQRMVREQAPLSLIVGNFDCFKAYNDTYGHQAGDECLQSVAKVIINAVQRPADLVPRYGGEEFFVILPNTTAEEAIHVAEEIRYGVKVLEIAHPNSQVSQYLTLSLGVATILPTDEYASQMLIRAADQALSQAKTQGRDRIMLDETLLRQSTVVQPAKAPPLPEHQVCSLLSISKDSNGTATKTELLMSYVAYYLSRGKSVISPLSGVLSFEQSVYEYWGYHQDFQDFWQQLTSRHDFPDLYLQGDVYSFGEFLGGHCTVSECARCSLPIPTPEGHAYDVPNCTLCIESESLHPKSDHRALQGFEDAVNVTYVVAIGAIPTNPQALQQWFARNRFEVIFISDPEEVTLQSLPPSVDLVLIHGSSSEAQSQAWTQALHRYPQFQEVPIISLSPEAGRGLPWMERSLGVEDYVLAPYSGDRLARHLRQVRTLESNTNTTKLYWFPC